MKKYKGVDSAYCNDDMNCIVLNDACASYALFNDEYDAVSVSSMQLKKLTAANSTLSIALNDMIEIHRGLYAQKQDLVHLVRGKPIDECNMILDAFTEQSKSIMYTRYTKIIDKLIKHGHM